MPLSRRIVQRMDLKISKWMPKDKKNIQVIFLIKILVILIKIKTQDNSKIINKSTVNPFNKCSPNMNHRNKVN